MKINEFYKGKRVFITGHTGFKGVWLSAILLEFGSEITGYSLEPNTKPNLFDIIGLDKNMNSIIGDIRDLEYLQKAMCTFKPDIVLHLAAQPIVRESYLNPVGTYETNVMGTVNVLEAARRCNTVKSILNVTTDKVYRNNEWCYGYRETDALDGFDPYSNSKSCSELVTDTYRRSFFKGDIAVSTARAGNVIGGGDYAKDRIIPDCVRFAKMEKTIIIRNPHSIRPYQHVLEPLFAYLEIAKAQYENPLIQGKFNIGPDTQDCVDTESLVKMFCCLWGNNLEYQKLEPTDHTMHEASFLKLDNSKIKSVLGVLPRWNIKQAIEKVILFEKSNTVCDMKSQINKQIKEFYGKGR